MAMFIKNKNMAFSLILMCFIVVSPMANAQFGGLPGTNILNIQGLVTCSINGSVSTNGTVIPPFAGVPVVLQCAGQNVSTTTTGANGVFSFPSTTVFPISLLSTLLASGCRVIVTAPLSRCMQVYATPRITLKPLVPSFPCFANIFVSLMDKPQVDFGLKLLGVDVMAIPGLYGFVQEIIKDQVANMYLWPKTLCVQIMDPSTAMKKPVGLLNVKVIKAIKLKKKDFLGGSDPYVKLTLSGDRVPGKKTVVKHSNLNPEWNEEFDLVVKEPESQELLLIVYDWEQVGKHDTIGMNVIQLKDLTPEEPKLMTLELLKSMEPNEPVSEKSRGQLVVEVEYKPFKEDNIPDYLDDPNAVEKAPEGTPSGGGLLVVIVHEAEDLEGKYHTNPYVRLLFRGEERKTKRVKKNREPRWDEDFQFPLDEPPVNDKLHVEVISTSSRMGLIQSKEALGYVVINLADVVSNRRINDKYHLIDSKNGRVQIELQWRTSS